MFIKLLPFIKPNKKWFFIPLFFSIYIIYLWIQQQNFELYGFPKGIISIATLSKFDVNQRVTTFYQTIYLLIFCFLTFSLAINFIERKKLVTEYSLISLNYLSFFATIILIIQILTTANKYLLDILLILQLLLFIQELIIKYLFKKAPSSDKKNIYFWSIFISFSILFPIREFCSYTLIPFGISLFYKLFFILNLILTNILYVLIRKDTFSINKIFNWLKPIVWFPLISIISQELYLIINNKGFHGFSQKYAYLLLLTLVIIWTISLFYFKRNPTQNVRKTINNYYAPVFVFGILSFIGYVPFINQSTDIFELANPANAVMRVIKFKEIPMVDFLSSHLLSEQLFPYLYTLLNGFNGTHDFLLYDFLLLSISGLITYYFIKFVFRSMPIAISISLLFPYLYVFFPLKYSILFVSILIFYHLVKKYSIAYLIISLIWTFFLLAWKPEVGLANFYASVIFMAVALIVNFRKSTFYDFTKVFTMLLISISIILFILSQFTTSDIFTNFKKALEYFTANQAHGLVSLSYQPNRIFKYHYFIFPVLITISSIILLFFSLIKKNTLVNKRIVFSISFLVIIYIIGAQRGLVRHNMFSNSLWFSSFSFLIFSLLITYFSIVRKINNRGIIFITATVILISNFTFPEKNEFKAPLESYIKKFVKFDKLWGTSNSTIQRINDPDNFVENNFGAFKSFLNSNISKSATFYDFSNTPMTYFYTQRSIPSYFNQIPICINTKALQKQHLIDLEQHNLPVVVFSNIPQTFWDHVDGVPNELRHGIITQWIYDNYSPSLIINNHTIWLHNSSSEIIKSTNEKVLLDIKPIKKEIEIGSFDKVLKGYLIAQIKTHNKNDLTDFTINGKPYHPFFTDFNGSFKILLNNGAESEKITICSTDTIYNLQLIQMQHCPDTISFKHKNFNLMKLAFIEGTYGKHNYINKIELHFSKSIQNNELIRLEIQRNFNQQFNYLELISLPVSKREIVNCKFGINNIELGSFSFELIPNKTNSTYLIPLFSQFNWQKAPINYISISTDNPSEPIFTKFSLIEK